MLIYIERLFRELVPRELPLMKRINTYNFFIETRRSWENLKRENVRRKGVLRGIFQHLHPNGHNDGIAVTVVVIFSFTIAVPHQILSIVGSNPEVSFKEYAPSRSVLS